VEIKDVLHHIISRYLLERDLMQKLLEGSEILCRTSIRFPLANLSIEDVLHKIISPLPSGARSYAEALH
jgi:hypothetical protein